MKKSQPLRIARFGCRKHAVLAASCSAFCDFSKSSKRLTRKPEPVPKTVGAVAGVPRDPAGVPRRTSSSPSACFFVFHEYTSAMDAGLLQTVCGVAAANAAPSQLELERNRKSTRIVGGSAAPSARLRRQGRGM